MTTSRHPIILDCDPGHDDAIAMLLALASPELEVLGVTATYGNVSLPRTARNALVVRELAGSGVPVYLGADRPLVRDRISAENVHGLSGLEGPDLPEPAGGFEGTRAAEFIVSTVLARPGEVSIVPIGPLTTLALAMRLEPRIVPAIRSVVLMGGSLDIGNTTPNAEFNILCDPHAARAVFEAEVPRVMFGLNLTHQARATPQRVERFRALGTRVGLVTASLLEFYRSHHYERYGWDGAPLHDPCTVAYLLRPELFSLKPMAVEVDTAEGLGFGRTVCDLWGVTGKAPTTEVGLEVDAAGFFDLLLERLSSYRD